LVCEGQNNGLDNRVLDRLVIQFHNLGVQVAPSGGGGGLGAVRVYLLNLSQNNTAISIEDRDYYRTRADAHAGWGDLQAERYTWRRHEIENYLLHPQVVLALFDDYRAATVAWSFGLPTTESGVLAMLQAVATPMLENHAAELLRVELLRQSVAGGNLQFGPATPTAPPGAIVAGQAEWIPALQARGYPIMHGLHDCGGKPGLRASRCLCPLSNHSGAVSELSLLSVWRFPY
jgi:hypothetical protein